MKRRFIVMLNSSTNEQNEAFLAYIKETDIGWWHFISNSWLLYDAENKISAEIIRDKLMEIYPSVTNLVIEVTSPHEPWQGFGPNGGPNGDNLNMFTWLKENWKSD
jgi:hypothetical protein